MNQGIVYSSKARTVIVLNPKHGMTGWMPQGETKPATLEEVIFVDRPIGGLSRGWVTGEDFRRAVRQKKQSNYEYFKANPQLLREKIRGPYTRSARVTPTGFVRVH